MIDIFLILSIVTLMFSNLAFGFWFMADNRFTIYSKIAEIENMKTIGKVILGVFATPFSIFGSVLVLITFSLWFTTELTKSAFLYVFAKDKQKLIEESRKDVINDET